MKRTAIIRKVLLASLCFSAALFCYFVLAPPIASAAAGLRDGLFKTVQFATGATVDEFSTDTLLSGNSDTAVPTEKAVKAYADGLSGSIATTSGTFTNADLDGSDDFAVVRAVAGSKYPSSVAVYNGSDEWIGVPYTTDSTTTTTLDLTGEVSVENGALVGTWKYEFTFNY